MLFSASQQKQYSPLYCLNNHALYRYCVLLSERLSLLIKVKKTPTRLIVWLFQIHRMFLHSLYQRMITGQVYVSSPDSSALSRYSWSDMCNLVSEQLSAQLSELNKVNERVSKSYLLTSQFHVLK